MQANKANQERRLKDHDTTDMISSDFGAYSKEHRLTALNTLSQVG